MRKRFAFTRECKTSKTLRTRQVNLAANPQNNASISGGILTVNRAYSGTTYSVVVTATDQLSQTSAGNTLSVTDAAAQTFQYPPVDMTGNTTNVSGQSYGNGTYTASSSTSFGGGYAPYMGFTATTSQWWASGGYRYNTVTGLAGGTNGTTTTISSGTTYTGDWCQVAMPLSITVRSYKMIPTVAIGQAPSPQTWVLGGSTDGTTWTTIHVQTNASLAYSTSYTYTVSPGGAFAYYRSLPVSSFLRR